MRVSKIEKRVQMSHNAVRHRIEGSEGVLVDTSETAIGWCDGDAVED